MPLEVLRLDVTMTSNLDQLRSYRCEPVVARFQKNYPDYAEQGDQIFEDLMTFFWATKQHNILKGEMPNNEELDFVFIMDEKMKMIDEMWHVFLLFTKPYMDFCYQNFGEFIHHTPNIAPSLPATDEFYKTNLTRFLSFTYDILGEETVRRWFDFEESEEILTG